MICLKCGSEILDKSIFCRICGTKIVNEDLKNYAQKNSYNNSYDELGKIVEEKETEFIIKDYYNKALKDIDTKNYTDLADRIDYLVNFYSDKKDIIELCDKVVKIIERNSKDIDLHSISLKLQRAYPDKYPNLFRI